jgi:DNA invertase Pin-like site-specific DNA recombinase
MNAFSYLRVSDKSQIEGDGFPRQRAAITKQAKTMGIEIVREYVEQGVTGIRLGVIALPFKRWFRTFSTTEFAP